MGKFALRRTQGAKEDKDSEKRLDAERAGRREIRTALSARLREYYENMQDMPVPNHLADLIDRLSERIRQSERKAGNNR
jgi:hypothetical protein